MATDASGLMLRFRCTAAERRSEFSRGRQPAENRGDCPAEPRSGGGALRGVLRRRSAALPVFGLLLFEAALRLPGPQRARLADRLLDSVDSEWEKAWGEEISRRIAEIENGTAKFVNWEDLRRELWEAVHAARKTPTA